MIFSLQFVLIFAGYGAVSILSGNYMELYAGANDIQLGFYFMIPHILHLTRPFIGSQADRNGSHKRVYTWCALIAALSYLPYILLPFFLKNPYIANNFPMIYRFWMLVVFHITGSIALNGCRTLADVLAKNYANRANIEYVSMRKYAPVGMGLCGYFFGFLNEEWIMPDYVPAMFSFAFCMLLLAILVHCWPDEFFKIVCNKEEKVDLPSNKEIFERAMRRLIRPFKKRTSYVKQLETMEQNENKMTTKSDDTNSIKAVICKQNTISSMIVRKTEQKKSLTVGQQLRILGLVLRRDFRICLTFAVLFFGGWICRSAQNFVFVQLEDICDTRKTCHAGKLSGDVLAGMSILEFLTYVSLSALRNFRLNRLMLLEIAILSIMIHYYFFAFFIEHLHTLWFMVESLNGFEFAIIITSSLGWGYTFAGEVQYIIPELRQRGIITEQDDLELVKVSLVATMMSCMTVLFEGLGSTIGSFTYGVVIQEQSYSLAWKINGSLALAEFTVIFIALVLNHFFTIRPEMSKLKSDSTRSKMAEVRAS